MKTAKIGSFLPQICFIPIPLLPPHQSRVTPKLQYGLAGHAVGSPLGVTRVCLWFAQRRRRLLVVRLEEFVVNCYAYEFGARG